MVSYLLNEDRGSCPSCLKRLLQGNSLAVQWLGLRVIAAEDVGSVSGWGTNVLWAVWRGQKEKRKKKKGKVIVRLNETVNVATLRCCSSTRCDGPLYLEILEGFLSMILNYILTLTIHYPGCQTQNKEKQTHIQWALSRICKDDSTGAYVHNPFRLIG